MSTGDAVFTEYLEEVDVKDVTMSCLAYGGDCWVVRAHLYGLTARSYVLPCRCKTIIVHAKVETLLGSEDCVRTEPMDTVIGAAEQWAKECLTSGVPDEEKKELRVLSN
jgi:hypothetical protein